MKYIKSKGTKDITFEECEKWQKIEEEIRKICKCFNIKEIRTPVFESTELFLRSVGDDTDIVKKEMYTFEDKGKRSITLRPEGTAGVVRSYIENGMASMPTPIKMWYLINVYRYEKMQKGRYREFNQFGIEFLGAESYLADYEAIMVARMLFEKLGLSDKITLNINSIGCSQCRKNYIENLKNYIAKNLELMCDDCKSRFETNPLRILDCKEEKCREILKDAPSILDYLCADCKTHFDGLKKMLDDNKIKYVINSKIVRGLDYYNRTVFEYISNKNNITLCGGGRYDLLVTKCGGNDTPAVGFAAGIERIIIELEESGYDFKIDKSVDICVVTTDGKARNEGTKLVYELRKLGIKVEQDIVDRNIKAQFKYADKINAKYSVIIGDDEINLGKVKIKNMKTSEEFVTQLNVEKILKSIKESW